jgi:hypothetical protein
MKSLLTKLGVILIGLTVFGYAELCNAQNWGLWQYVRSEKLHAEYWENLGAFPSYELCIKEWDKKVSLSATSVNAQEITKGEFLITYKDGSTSWAGYKCLPDTVDLRK